MVPRVHPPPALGGGPPPPHIMSCRVVCAIPAGLDGRPRPAARNKEKNTPKGSQQAIGKRNGRCSMRCTDGKIKSDEQKPPAKSRQQHAPPSSSRPLAARTIAQQGGRGMLRGWGERGARCAHLSLRRSSGALCGPLSLRDVVAFYFAVAQAGPYVPAHAVPERMTLGIICLRKCRSSPLSLRWLVVFPLPDVLCGRLVACPRGPHGTIPWHASGQLSLSFALHTNFFWPAFRCAGRERSGGNGTAVLRVCLWESRPSG